METSFASATIKNFLGNAPIWYKQAIITFLVINPIIFMINPFVAGWVLVIEFIFTLAMALKCYPLQPGGLLAIEAVAIGMTTSNKVYEEVSHNFPVILLLIFMVAGIYFMKDLLLFIFTKLLTKLKSKLLLSLAFVLAGAILSAFLDALTVIAVVISVVTGFYSIYHKVASGKDFHHEHDHTSDEHMNDLTRSDLEGYRSFLRSLAMHAAVGTALGGVCTMVGEPQNLIIADVADWSFIEFVLRVAPVSLPVLIMGFVTTIIVEKFNLFGYGAQLPAHIRTILEDYDQHEDEKRTVSDKSKLVIQGLIGLWLVLGLAFHMAEVGLIGLSVIVLATSFTGIIEEHQLGKAFEEALPFTALLVVFFSIVAVIIDLELFSPVIYWVLSFEGNTQLSLFYIANGFLSMVSDNVFVGTVYINEVRDALLEKQITREQFDLLAVAINTGTNLPSVATPNGQAAFLFMLTSALAPLLRLSYGRMVIMAFPYTIVLSIVGILSVIFLLEPATDWLYSMELIHLHTGEITSAAGH